MSFSETIRTTVDLYKTIKNRRETEKVLETKFYAISSGVVGVTIGVLVGIVAIVVQMGFPDFENSTLFSVVMCLFLVALLALDIWLIYPLLLDKSIEIMQKVMNTLITLILSVAGFFFGVYGIFIILVLAILYIILKIALPIMFKK